MMSRLHSSASHAFTPLSLLLSPSPTPSLSPLLCHSSLLTSQSMPPVSGSLCKSHLRHHRPSHPPPPTPTCCICDTGLLALRSGTYKFNVCGFFRFQCFGFQLVGLLLVSFFFASFCFLVSWMVCLAWLVLISFNCKRFACPAEAFLEAWRLGGSQVRRIGWGSWERREGKGMERKEKEGKGRKRNEKEVRTRK